MRQRGPVSRRTSWSLRVGSASTWRTASTSATSGSASSPESPSTSYGRPAASSASSTGPNWARVRHRTARLGVVPPGPDPVRAPRRATTSAASSSAVTNRSTRTTPSPAPGRGRRVRTSTGAPPAAAAWAFNGAATALATARIDSSLRHAIVRCETSAFTRRGAPSGPVSSRGKACGKAKSCPAEAPRKP